MFDEFNHEDMKSLYGTNRIHDIMTQIHAKRNTHDHNMIIMNNDELAMNYNKQVDD